MTLVKPGQTWEHVASGDVRIVFDIVTYEEASGGYDPPEHYVMSGMTHVARMVYPDMPIRRDRRDSSDMVLVKTDDGFRPAFCYTSRPTWRFRGEE